GRGDGQRAEDLGDVGAGENRLDTFHGPRGARVDGADAAMRHIAPFERQVLHPDDLHVIDVGGPALNEARILAAPDALAYELRQYGSRHHGLWDAALCAAD